MVPQIRRMLLSLVHRGFSNRNTKYGSSYATPLSIGLTTIIALMISFHQFSQVSNTKAIPTMHQSFYDFENSKKGFERAIVSVAVGDIDNDGDLDIAVSSDDIGAARYRITGRSIQMQSAATKEGGGVYLFVNHGQFFRGGGAYQDETIIPPYQFSRGFPIQPAARISLDSLSGHSTDSSVGQLPSAVADSKEVARLSGHRTYIYDHTNNRILLARPRSQLSGYDTYVYQPTVSTRRSPLASITTDFIHTEYPQVMMLNQAGTVQSSVVYENTTAPAHFSRSSTHLGILRPINPISTPLQRIPVSAVEGIRQAYGPDYEASIIAILYGAGMEIAPETEQKVSLIDRNKVQFSWSVLPLNEGVQELNLKIYVEWTPKKGGQPIRTEMYSDTLKLTVEVPPIVYGKPIEMLSVAYTAVAFICGGLVSWSAQKVYSEYIRPRNPIPVQKTSKNKTTKSTDSERKMPRKSRQ